MLYKSLINIIIILVLSTFTLSVPLIVQDIGSFYCRNGTNPNLYCCPLLAHRMASQNPQYQHSLAIILNNKSGYKLTLASANLENGHWINNSTINCEPQTDPLENGQSEAFASFSNAYQYKMQGLVTYVVGDDISSTFVLSWKLPISSYNDYFVYYLSGKKYKVQFQYGLQNTVLQVTFYPPPPPEYPKYPKCPGYPRCSGSSSRYPGYPGYSTSSGGASPTSSYPWALQTPLADTPVQKALNV